MEFNLVQTTTRAPFNKCYLCGDHEGPYIDCFYEQHGWGWVALCAPRYGDQGEMVRPGCVGNMAGKVGWISPHIAEQQRVLIESLELRIVELESLERQIIVNEDDLRALVTAHNTHAASPKKKTVLKVEEATNADG